MGVKAGTKLQRGECPFCSRVIALCKDGTMRGHVCGRGYHQGGGMPASGAMNRSAARRLGALGGRARAAALTAEQRSDIAKQAVLTRWKRQSSVPLSAIRALVQQWRETVRLYRETGRHPVAEVHAFRDGKAQGLAECAHELAALCPAPPEDRK